MEKWNRKERWTVKYVLSSESQLWVNGISTNLLENSGKLCGTGTFEISLKETGLPASISHLLKTAGGGEVAVYFLRLLACRQRWVSSSGQRQPKAKRDVGAAGSLSQGYGKHLENTGDLDLH